MTARGAVSGASSLLTGLNVYYALSNVNDATGGGLTLTNNNTVTFSAGKVGDAANFVAASNQSLSRADNAAFQMGAAQDFSFCGWVNYTSGATIRAVCYGDVDNVGYGFYCSSDISSRVKDGTTGPIVNSAGSFNDGAWHLVVVTVSRAGDQTLYVDNVSQGTPASMAGVGAISTAIGFQIGANNAAGFFDGSIDEVGIWNRVLTGAELSALWNSGNGVTYPF